MSVFTRTRITLFACALLALAQAAVAADPGDRTQMRMAFDERTARTVLFGGATPLDQATQTAFDLNDTWEYNGVQWIQRFPANVPPGRSVYAMAYDSKRQRTIMFGGKSGKSQLNDTWSWDGNDWTKITTAHSPSARVLSDAAYDSARDRIVLFGGSIIGADGKSFTGVYDTWEFDGTDWTQVQQTGPTVAKPTLVYDAARNQTLMLGIDNSLNTLMYSWDPAAGSWNQMKPAKLPDCANEGAAAYQSHNQIVVFYSGTCASSGLTGETDEWDGTNWIPVDTTNLPDRISGAAMAYDSSRQQTLMYGGTLSFGNAQGKSLTYKDGVWNDVHDPNAPSSRSLFVMQGDPVKKLVWLFGGIDEQDTLSDFWQYTNGIWVQKYGLTNGPAVCNTPNSALDTDRGVLVVVCADSSTFEFNGTDWTTMSPKTKPPYGRFRNMVYDPTLKKTVLFGGFDDLNYSNETWVWNGTDWTRQKNNPPTARNLAAMWYDPQMKKTVVYGGLGRPSSLDRLQRYTDMWSFDGNGWTQMKAVTSTPGPRYGPQYVVDPASGKLLLFGGILLKTDGIIQSQTYANDMWQWDGGTQKWTELKPDVVPSGRENGGMTWDPVQDTILLFGGFDGHYLSDVWTYDRAKNTWLPKIESPGPIENPTPPRRRAVPPISSPTTP